MVGEYFYSWYMLIICSTWSWPMNKLFHSVVIVVLFLDTNKRQGVTMCFNVHTASFVDHKNDDCLSSDFPFI